MLMNSQGKLRHGKKEIEYQHTADGREHIAGSSGGCHGSQQGGKQVNCNDVCLGETHLRGAIAQDRSDYQNADG